MADALHEAAVAADDEGVVVDELGTEAGPKPTFGDAHAHAVAKPWPSGPVVTSTPGGQVDLGMARRPAAPLPELPDVVEGEPVAGEVEHRVQQDGGVSVGEDEAVTVGPVRVDRVVAHDPGEEHVGQRGQGHGGTRVARVGLLRGVHGQATDDVDPELFELRFGHDETVPVRRALDSDPLRPTRPGPGPGPPPGGVRMRAVGSSATEAVNPWTKLCPPTGPSSPAAKNPAMGTAPRCSDSTRTSWWGWPKSRVPRPLQLKTSAASARRPRRGRGGPRPRWRRRADGIARWCPRQRVTDGDGAGGPVGAHDVAHQEVAPVRSGPCARR